MSLQLKILPIKANSCLLTILQTLSIQGMMFLYRIKKMMISSIFKVAALLNILFRIKVEAFSKNCRELKLKMFKLWMKNQATRGLLKLKVLLKVIKQMSHCQRSKMFIALSSQIAQSQFCNQVSISILLVTILMTYQSFKMPRLIH